MVVFCKTCGKEFHNISNLKRHQNLAHSKDEDEDMESDDGSQSAEESESEEQENAWIIDIWDMLTHKAKSTNTSLSKVYRYYVLLVKSFKYDQIHQQIMGTVKRAQDEEEMDFLEALDYSIKKMSFLINRHAETGSEHSNEEDDEDDEEVVDDDNEVEAPNRTLEQFL